MKNKKYSIKVSPGFYASLYEELKQSARKCGYALAIHGSMMRDFDLVAIPWTDDAADPEMLVRSMAKAIGWKVLSGDPGGSYPGSKPHGRMTWPIHLEGGTYIDLSIMPRL